MLRFEHINGWGPIHQLLGYMITWRITRRPTLGHQEIDGWYPGIQWMDGSTSKAEGEVNQLGSRTSIIAAEEPRVAG